MSNPKEINVNVHFNHDDEKEDIKSCTACESTDACEDCDPTETSERCYNPEDFIVSTTFGVFLVEDVVLVDNFTEKTLFIGSGDRLLAQFNSDTVIGILNTNFVTEITDDDEDDDGMFDADEDSGEDFE
jgi:hypothetical protein